jgi:signal transduction histidine kinase
MRLLKLSEDVLQVSRIDSGTFDLRLEAVDLDSLIRNAIVDVEKSHSGQKSNLMIVFASDLDKNRQRSSFKAHCDPAKIGQTLFNLIDNAFRFTEEGQILVGAGIYDDEIIIHVRDPGQGIDPEIRSRLFEKFASKSNGGTGLGLYLSKKIMEAHGGRIWVEDNRSGSGTTFYIAFPLDLEHDAVDRKNIMQSGVRAK